MVYLTRKRIRKNSKKRRKRTILGGSETVKLPTYIKRTDESAPTSVHGIPLVVYRSWITNDIKRGMYNAVMDTIKLTPEFDNYFYSDVECLKFIEENFEPDVAKAFRSLRPGAYQSDFWRYCILYKKGGVYINIPIILQIPLIDVIKETPLLFIKDHISGQQICTGVDGGIWNGLMASPPGNDIFKRCIDEIVETCKHKKYWKNPIDITVCTLSRQLYNTYGADFIKSLPSEHIVLPSKEFTYKGRPFFKQYDEYRENQKKNQKTNHYSKMWAEHKVFNNSITFG
jgi:mannosyltransferase OCH1-like enzyme